MKKSTVLFIATAVYAISALVSSKYYSDTETIIYLAATAIAAYFGVALKMKNQ